MKKSKSIISQIGLFFEEWWLLIKVIFSRFIMGFKSVNFIFYFLFIVIMLGGLGVWVEFLKIPTNIEPINMALITFYMAILASSSADLILRTKPKEEMKVLKMPALSILILGGVLAILTLMKIGPSNLATIGAIFALIFWWITNSKDKKYKTIRSIPISTMGGTVTSSNNGNSSEEDKKEQFEGIKH